MPTPSLLIVPARFKTGRLYSQIPTANGDFTVTRDTAARRFDSAGLVASVASGIPRLDYFTSGGVTGCPALLVEPAATNIFVESQTLFTSPHLVQNLTTSGYTNATASPDGSVTAEKFVPNGTTAGLRHGVANGSSLAITSGTTYTFSLFVKSDGGPYNLISLTFDNSTAWGATKNCIFDASDGTNFTVPAGATMTSENYGNGWYRIRATLTAVVSVAAGLYQYRIYVADALGNIAWGAPSGNTNGIFCWGAQVETGSVATSYIPTTAGTGSRSADVISVSGAVSGSIGQTAGVVYAQVDLRNWTASGRVLAISDGTSDARVVIQVGANRTLQAVVTAASGEVANIATASGQVNGIYKCAVAYASGDFAFYVNGNQIGTDSSGAVPACNNVALGKIETSASTNFLNDRILAGALYNTRLLNAELATLTTP